jgi:hypothetical protein
MNTKNTGKSSGLSAIVGVVNVEIMKMAFFFMGRFYDRVTHYFRSLVCHCSHNENPSKERPLSASLMIASYFSSSVALSSLPLLSRKSSQATSDTLLFPSKNG